MTILNDSSLSKAKTPNTLKDILLNANIVGVGEGAHFVSEFSTIRFNLIRHLINLLEFNTIGLECSAIQGEKLNKWLNETSDEINIGNYASPLTRGLYGSVLLQLKKYLKNTGRRVKIIGVDIPNTLSPIEEYESMCREATIFDPEISTALNELGKVINGISGESAVNSSSSWVQLSEELRQKGITIATRLRLRYEALEPLFSERYQKEIGLRYYQSLLALQYTLEALAGMSALFRGSGIEGETSVRDHFMSKCITSYMDKHPETKLIVLAHNNHIQKVPVVFSGELAGIPMGQYLCSKENYRAVALTHIGDTVPEMVFPDNKSPVGFSVMDSPASPLEPKCIEYLCSDLEKRGETQSNYDRTFTAQGIRSQNSIAEMDINAGFDMVIYSNSATKDKLIEF